MDENQPKEPVSEENPAVAVDHDGEEISVLGLLEEMKSEFKPFQMQTLPRAELQERYIHGDQNLELGLNNEVQMAGWGEGIPNVTHNHLRNLTLTYASRIMEDRPSVKAWPADPQRSDQAAAEVANAIIDHQRNQQDIDAMLERAAILAQAHGSIAFKVCWDKKRGPKEFFSGQMMRMGDVFIELKTVFDYIVDPVERIEDAMWVAFRTYLDKEDARERVRKGGGDVDAVEEVDPEFDIWGARKKGVETWEIWHLPCTKFPRGFYGVVVGGAVAVTDVYPYEHGELPLSVWKIQSRRDHPHGTTHVSDALPLQRSINEGLSVAQKLKRDVGDYVKAFLPATIAENLSASNQVFGISSPEQAQMFGWMKPPVDAINHLYDNVARDEAAMFQVFGLNEMLTGKESAKASHSGKAIAYMKQLDSQKLAHSARNLGECMRRTWRQVLGLYKQYVQATRIQQIIGPGGEIKQVIFNGTMLDGLDFVLEPHSGSEDFRAARSEATEQAAAAGYIDPQRAGEMRLTGLSSTFDEGLDVDAVGQQIDAIMQGMMVQPDRSINPAVAVRELQQAFEIYQDRPEVARGIQMLMMQYQMMQQQMQQQSQMQQQQQMRPKPTHQQQPNQIIRGGVTQ